MPAAITSTPLPNRDARRVRAGKGRTSPLPPAGIRIAGASSLSLADEEVREEAKEEEAEAYYEDFEEERAAKRSRRRSALLSLCAFSTGSSSESALSTSFDPLSKIIVTLINTNRR